MPVEVVERPSSGEGRVPGGAGLGKGRAGEAEVGWWVRGMLRLRKDMADVT